MVEVGVRVVEEWMCGVWGFGKGICGVLRRVCWEGKDCYWCEDDRCKIEEGD